MNDDEKKLAEAILQQNGFENIQNVPCDKEGRGISLWTMGAMTVAFLQDHNSVPNNSWWSWSVTRKAIGSGFDKLMGILQGT